VHRVVTAGGRTLRYVVPYDSSNSTVRTRCVSWLEELAASGSDVAVSVDGPGFVDAAATFDRVVVLRNAGRFSRGKAEAAALGRAELGVYELDDGLPWDDGRLAGHRSWRKRPWPRSLIARRAATAADRVIAGNAVLADWASQHCDDVRIIPTCVRPSDYRQRVHWERADVAVIGWIGSPATEPYVWGIAASLAAVCARLGARVEIISGRGEIPPILAPHADRIVWSADATARLAAWDVGIMPLHDGVYERAKCGYKLLQYAASGVPAIGSPVGYNTDLLKAMGAPMPTTGDEWADALFDVLSDQSHRQRIARAGFDVAERHSYAHWFATWSAAVGVDT
jgi:glycosyltransferase involved in cell wall biosynthesis